MCGSLCSMAESDDRIIVEVKYDNQHIEQAAKVVQSLGAQFRKVSNSKYSTGIDRLYFGC